MSPKTIYEIDGENFYDLEGFYDEVSLIIIPNAYWGRNLDALNDILRGGFGTPYEGFKLIWKNSAISELALGYKETVRQLEKRLEHCHPSNRVYVAEDLEQAKAGQGETVFDWLVGLIRDHGTGGQQEGDGVELILQ